MAFNWQTFKTRTLTAVVFVAVMLIGLLWNRWSFFILFSVVHFGCWVEYQRLVSGFNKEYASITPFQRYGVMIAGWCLMLYFTDDQLHIAGLRLHEVGWWLGLMAIFLLPLMELLLAKNIWLKNIGYSLCGILYISLSLGLLMDLRNRWDEATYRLNMVLPLLIVFSLWINDTMAYIVGSLIGKTPLSKVSPKKTWEGTIGGIILSVIVMGLIASATHYLPPVHAAIMAGLAAICGTYGDLFESKLKRLAGVKDSGHIMPGHGGFLDRFDSLLFASVIVWVYAVIIF